MSQLEELAQKYGFSPDAIQTLISALEQTGGRAAQFNHPELGGMGQWMPQMMMLGDMNNHALKARVNALCQELAELIQATDRPTRPSSPLAGMWWSPQLGEPDQQGGNNHLQYAYFAAKHCVAVKVGEDVQLYNTAPYEITGIAVQDYGAAIILEFQTRDGLILPLNRLKPL